MKKILLCTDGSSFSHSSYQYVAWLALRLGASIEVLYVSDIRAQKAVSTGDFSASLGSVLFATGFDKFGSYAPIMGFSMILPLAMLTSSTQYSASGYYAI